MQVLKGSYGYGSLSFACRVKAAHPRLFAASNFWFLSPDISSLTTFPLTSGL
jgi:hypothetical protein